VAAIMDDQTVPALQFSYEHVGTVVPVRVHIAGLAQVVFHPIATDSRHVRDALRMRISVQQKSRPEARAVRFRKICVLPASLPQGFTISSTVQT